ncbi:MAG TPA: hypothetical protein VHG28_01005 [Longimicrobiaceae bacterium]|nr:hypothetical protein [Longimicrobiaceae bacterium]
MLRHLLLAPLLLALAGPLAAQEGTCVGRIPGLSVTGRGGDTLRVTTADGARLSWPLRRDSLPDRITPRAVPYERFGLRRTWTPGEVRLAGLYRGLPLLRERNDTVTSLPEMALVWVGPPCDFQAYVRAAMFGETGRAQPVPRDRSTLDSLAVTMEYCGEESCPTFRAVLRRGLLRYHGQADAFPPGRCEAALPPAAWTELLGALDSLREDTLAQRYGVRLHTPRPTIELYFRGESPVRVSGGYLPEPVEVVRAKVERLVRERFGFRDATERGSRRLPRACRRPGR